MTRTCYLSYDVAVIQCVTPCHKNWYDHTLHNSWLLARNVMTPRFFSVNGNVSIYGINRINHIYGKSRGGKNQDIAEMSYIFKRIEFVQNSHMTKSSFHDQ